MNERSISTEQCPSRRKENGFSRREIASILYNPSDPYCYKTELEVNVLRRISVLTRQLFTKTFKPKVLYFADLVLQRHTKHAALIKEKAVT
jgi:hypothetical protein